MFKFEKELEMSRITAIRYLNELARVNLLKKIELGRGRENYYINNELIHLLTNINSL